MICPMNENGTNAVKTQFFDFSAHQTFTLLRSQTVQRLNSYHSIFVDHPQIYINSETKSFLKLQTQDGNQVCNNTYIQFVRHWLEIYGRSRNSFNVSHKAVSQTTQKKHKQNSRRISQLEHRRKNLSQWFLLCSLFTSNATSWLHSQNEHH